MRFVGFSVSMRSSRAMSAGGPDLSTAAAEELLNSGAMFIGSRLSKGTKLGRRSTSGQLAAVGVPSTLKILPSCSTSELPVCSPFSSKWNLQHVLLPGKRGTLNSISANMHPIAHTSTPPAYRDAPNSSSGARYHLNHPVRSERSMLTMSHTHLVTTSLVNCSGEE